MDEDFDWNAEDGGMGAEGLALDTSPPAPAAADPAQPEAPVDMPAELPSGYVEPTEEERAILDGMIPTSPPFRVMVTNLKFQLTENELRAFFT